MTKVDLGEPSAQHRLSSRFLAPELERSYQLAAGAESRAGLRIITGASAALWLAGAFLIPIGTSISRDLATAIAIGMSAISVFFFFAAARADTLDHQHAIATVLTAGNGLVILWLASVGGVLPGYGVSAILLLFAYGFVSRTRFVFAAVRSVVIGIGFAVAAVNYPGPGGLVLDAFLLSAAIFGTLLALRMLEQSRRRVFVQDLVIANQSAALAREKEKSDRVLLDVLPASISARLRQGEHTIADKYPDVSVLFADVVGFTPLVARLSPSDVTELLSELFGRFDELVSERQLEKIKTIGDAYMVAAGLPEPIADHAERAVDLGMAMIDAASGVGKGRWGGGCMLRVGVHSGAVVAGVIGRRRIAFDVWGDTVNVASRLEAQGLPNRVHISRETWHLVRDRFEAEPRQPLRLRGLGVMQTYAVIGRHPPQPTWSMDPVAGGPFSVRQRTAAALGSMPT